MKTNLFAFSPPFLLKYFKNRFFLASVCISTSFLAFNAAAETTTNNNSVVSTINSPALNAVNPTVRVIDPSTPEGKELIAQFKLPSALPVIPSPTETAVENTPIHNIATRVYHHPILNKISQQAVVNIQTTGGQSQEKQAVGSGFIITQDGYIVTNFHVISEHFFNPKDTQLLVRLGTNTSTPVVATLENVDIVKDLALIKITPKENNGKKEEYNFFQVSGDSLDVGQKVYSLGFPNNWNLTAIEGIANGEMSKKIIPRYLISHSLTGGMSGGPTVDETGRVVGINVAATAKLSVVIPSQAVADLFATRFDSSDHMPDPKTTNTTNTTNTTEDNKENKNKRSNFSKSDKTQFLRDKSYADYEAFTKELVNKIASSNSKMKLGDFNLNLDGDFMECWSAGLDKNNIWSGSMRASSNAYDNTLLSCSTTDDVFLNDKQKLGGIKFYISHYNAKTDLIFWKNLENIYNLTALRNSNILEQSSQKTGYHCKHENIKLGSAQKLHTCIAQLKQNPNLYQGFITVGAYKESTSQKIPRNEAIVMTIIINGLSTTQLQVFNAYLYQFLKTL